MFIHLFLVLCNVSVCSLFYLCACVSVAYVHLMSGGPTCMTCLCLWVYTWVHVSVSLCTEDGAAVLWVLQI